MPVRTFLSAAALLAFATLGTWSCQQPADNGSNTATGASIQKTADGYSYRDLNKNGKLDVYEDSRQPIQARVNDLLADVRRRKGGYAFHQRRTHQ